MSKIFNRINGILLAGFLGGVLVVGLGCGVAWGEYSSFEYDDSLLAEEQLVVDEYVYEMSRDETVIVPSANTITTDDSVASGTLLIETEYNPSAIQVEKYVYEGEFQGVNASVVEIWGHYIRDDFELFMENKDAVLQGLKDGKLVRLESGYYFDVTVTCNPSDTDRVFANYDAAAQSSGWGRHEGTIE